MAHVVKQSGGTRGGTILFADGMFFAEAIEHAAHQVKRAERMREARVFGALISVESEAQLFDAS